jgi:hypothetical protein
MRSRIEFGAEMVQAQLEVENLVVVGKRNMLGKRRDYVLDLRFNRTRVTGKKRGGLHHAHR